MVERIDELLSQWVGHRGGILGKCGAARRVGKAHLGCESADGLDNLPA
jgi:hypothetical protein